MIEAQYRFPPGGLTTAFSQEREANALRGWLTMQDDSLSVIPRFAGMTAWHKRLRVPARHQPITHAWLIDDVLRYTLVIAEFFAQLADVHAQVLHVFAM